MEFLPIYFLLFVVLMTSISRKKNTIGSITAVQILKRKENNTNMIETAKKFIGLKCYVKTIDGSIFEGIVKGVSENSIILDKRNKAVAVNINYIINIEEIPSNKDQKSSIWDSFADFFTQ